jgi:NusA-like KH domain protein
MEKRILSSDLMKLIALFQAVTRTDVKDCFTDENGIVNFIVFENQIGKALGKKAANVKLLENKLKKRIKLIEFKAEVKSFIKSLLFPLKISDISEENGIIEVVPIDTKTRGMIIGRNAVNLRNTEKIVQRFFDIKEIKVVSPNNN